MKMKKLPGILLVFLFAVIMISVSAAADEEYDIFTYTLKNGQATITSIDAAGLKKIYIPEELNGNPVVAFYHGIRVNGASSPYELYIPSTVYDIQNPDNLGHASKIIVDENNEYYASDEYGFLYDKSMETLLKCPSSSTVKDYTAPSSLKKIDENAFKFNEKIETVVLPDGFREISIWAFYGATSLRSINFPEGMTVIDQGAFCQCYSLQEVKLPSSLTTFKNSSLAECILLKEIAIPENVTVLDYYVISDNPSLERVIIPDTVNTIRSGCFYNDFNLKHIYYTGTEEQWNKINIDTNKNEDMLSSAVIHYNYVPGSAFDGVEYSIQNGIMSIYGGDSIADGGINDCYFFEENKDEITTIIIDDVSYIGEYAFDGYPSLANIIFLSTDIYIEKNAFVNAPELETMVFFYGGSFTREAFDGHGEKLRIFADFEISTWDGASLIPFEFGKNVLSFSGEMSVDRYEFFDLISIFCLEFSDIEKIEFSSLAFEDIPLFYYSEETGERLPFEVNELKNGTITVSAVVGGKETSVTFNQLIDGISDGSITDFSMEAIDDTHGQAADTIFAIVRKALAKAIKWVVNLMNKLFKIISKK